MTKFGNAQVAAVFKRYPARVTEGLARLREIIFDTASRTSGVGELEETLKWGQPSYVTKSGIGSTIRIDALRNNPGYYAVYFHCQTTLVETFRKLYPCEFTYVGSRSIVFHVADHIPEEQLSHCIAMALTYHRNKQRPRDAASSNTSR
jgi:hypothetical protein